MTADEETYLRWTEFAATDYAFHGVTPREPWVYSRYAVSVYKFLCMAKRKSSEISGSYSGRGTCRHTNDETVANGIS